MGTSIVMDHNGLYVSYKHSIGTNNIIGSIQMKIQNPNTKFVFLTSVTV